MAKGNAGVEELSPTEAVIYDALIQKLWGHAFWTSHAMSQLGNEQNVGIHDFAEFLYKNRGARRTWETRMAVEQEFRKKLIASTYRRGYDEYRIFRSGEIAAT